MSPEIGLLGIIMAVAITAAVILSFYLGKETQKGRSFTEEEMSAIKSKTLSEGLEDGYNEGWAEGYREAVFDLTKDDWSMAQDEDSELIYDFDKENISEENLK